LARTRQSERIDLCDHMSTNPIGADESVDLVLTHGGFRNAMNLSPVAIRLGRAVRTRRGCAEYRYGSKRGPEFRLARKVRVLPERGKIRLPLFRHTFRIAQEVGVARLSVFSECSWIVT
jgi:hypothetical protein